MADISTGYQLLSAHVQIVWVFVLIGAALFVTRRRPAIDLAARSHGEPSIRVQI